MVMLTKLDEELLFDLIERQCADGMAFMAVHCGINLAVHRAAAQAGLPLWRSGIKGRRLDGAVDDKQ